MFEATFPEKRNDSLTSYNGCLPMLNDKEYILFLKSPIPSEGYTEKEYMYTSDKFAKYSFVENDYFIYDKDRSYNEIKDYNVILSNETDVEIYANIKNEILKNII